jgi:hypothetical protein
MHPGHACQNARRYISRVRSRMVLLLPPPLLCLTDFTSAFLPAPRISLKTRQPEEEERERERRRLIGSFTLGRHALTCYHDINLPVAARQAAEWGMILVVLSLLLFLSLSLPLSRSLSLSLSLSVSLSPSLSLPLPPSLSLSLSASFLS